MSKFKLDFNISDLPRRPQPCPSLLTQRGPKLAPVSEPPEKSAPEEADPVEDLHERPKEVNETKPRRLPRFVGVFVAFVTTAGIVLVLSASYGTQATQRARLCKSRANTVTCQPKCSNRGACTNQLAVFASNACADAIHSLHFHFADGRTRRVPAMYQRVPNSTMFVVGGDRVVFQPASCKAELRSVVVQPPGTKEGALHSHIVWIAAQKATRFVLRREGASIADLSAAVVKDRCVSPRHCTFKLPVHCDTFTPARVFAVDGEGAETEADSFLFC